MDDEDNDLEPVSDATPTSDTRPIPVLDIKPFPKAELKPIPVLDIKPFPKAELKPIPVLDIKPVPKVALKPVPNVKSNVVEISVQPLPMTKLQLQAVSELLVNRATDEPSLDYEEESSVSTEHYKRSPLSTDYWDAAGTGRTPLIARPKPDKGVMCSVKCGFMGRLEERLFGHACEILPLTTRLGFVLLCLLNLADTITDIITAIDMLLTGKYILGGLSVLCLVVCGHISQVNSLSKSVKRTACLDHLLVWSYLKFPARVLKMLVRHDVVERRTNGHDYNTKGERCFSYKCQDIRHKLYKIYLSMMLEKMMENQIQFILQLINIAPEYVGVPRLEGSDTWDFQRIQRLVSLGLTVVMFAKACVSYYFNALGQQTLNRFDFYHFGKGAFALYPQKWLLFLVFYSDLLSRCTIVLFMVILTNHDRFPHLDKNEIPGIDDENKIIWTYYEIKVVGYLICYAAAIYFVMTMTNLFIFYTDNAITRSAVTTAPQKAGTIRETNLINFVIWQFPINFVFQNRLLGWSLTTIPLEHRHDKRMIFRYKVLPSLWTVLGRVVFVLLFLATGDNFDHIDIGIKPLTLSYIGVLVAVLHTAVTTIYLFYTDPQQFRKLSDEKKLTLLLKMGRVPQEIKTKCTRSTKSILRETIGTDPEFDVYEEDLVGEVDRCHQTLVLTPGLRGALSCAVVTPHSADNSPTNSDESGPEPQWVVVEHRITLVKDTFGDVVMYGMDKRDMGGGSNDLSSEEEESNSWGTEDESSDVASVSESKSSSVTMNHVENER